MSNINIPKTVPFLPGFQFSNPDKINHHKVQQFSLKDNTVCEKTNFIRESLDSALLTAFRTEPPKDNSQTRKQPENDYIPRIQPQWLKYDRQVLRFHCYFQEAVVESQLENFRVRPCILFYHLCDQSIYVTEPRVENSGITQGIFINRQKIPKYYGEQIMYSWEDFNIATNINLYERIFRIYDADDFTKSFYAEMEKPLNQPEGLPNDNFQFNKTQKDLKINPPDTKEYKEYFEVKLGGGHPNSGLQKYLSNDRIVLSFNIAWDDKTLEGQINYYVLNYYLANDTIEIKEKVVQNNGKDPYPLLLRRGKLPKQPIHTHYPGMTLKKEEFYKPTDFICGRYLTFYSRHCLIYDCDDLTKQWFLDNYGIQQQSLQFKETKGPKYTHSIPPYNGYGIEEDSLGSVFSLMPKPPKKDVKKVFSSDMFILRFEAKLLSESREDNDRKFIISFFCGNDTIMVTQIADKNSGIWAGKYLERMQHKHPQTGEYYNEKDFQLGEVIKLKVFQFQLLRADEFTLNYMKERPQTFASCNIQSCLEKVKKLSKQNESYDQFLVKLLQNINPKNQKSVSYRSFAQGLSLSTNNRNTLHSNLSYQEIYTIVREFEFENQFRLDIDKFFQALGTK